MNFIDNLSKQLSEITAYDVKSYYDKAKNMVMNYTEMEAKVREATNDDAWGASSSLMQEIAQGTFNFQLFNEIMPVIYKRFTEKEAREWRQIYKALQLLEYLVKHGSERVVDDARSHVSMIKMLRNFHYIDEKGKDQGINVRNRSKELAELLGDLDRVRQERKKAKANKSKYTGVGSDGTGFGSGGSGGSPSFISPTGSRYGGFGSDSYHASSSLSGNSFNADNYTSSSRTTRRDSFEDYDAGDDDVRKGEPAPASGRRSAGAPAPVKKDPPAPAQPKKEVNLFDFDDEPSPAPAPAPPAQKAPAHNRSVSFDDDFDDFQSAGASSAPAPAAAPAAAASKPASSANFFDMMGSSAPLAPASAQPQMRTSQNMTAGPTYPGVGLFGAPSQPSRPSMASSTSFSQPSVAQPAMQASKPKSAGAFDFDDLFAASGAKTSNGKTSASNAGTNSMASLAAQQSSSSVWGSAGQSGSKNANTDLLF